MAERLVSIPLFVNTPVSGLASGSRITSSAINLTQDVVSARSIIYMVSSVVSTADVGFFYAIGPNSQQFGSYADQAALQTSTLSTANSTGWFALSLPPAVMLAPYIQVTVSGTGSNPVDTRVHATLLLRMA